VLLVNITIYIHGPASGPDPMTSRPVRKLSHSLECRLRRYSHYWLSHQTHTYCLLCTALRCCFVL